MKNQVLLLFLFLCFLSCQTEKKFESDINTANKQLEIFGESLISTPLFERDIAISPNGDEIIFTRGDYKQTKRCLLHMTKESDGWSKPKILSFSGQYQDIEPFFSPNGNTLLFASTRPMDKDESKKDYNIWKVEKTANGWGIPKALPDVINTDRNEFYPSVGKSGNLYFTATYDYGVGTEDIFVSSLKDGVYQQPEPLDTNINTKTYEFNAYINPNEDLIIFSSFGRADGLGGGDLYMSRKDENGHWQKAKNLGSKINSKFLDYCPFVDLERNAFYFTSERMEANVDKLTDPATLQTLANQPLNGFGNIFRISFNELE